MTMPSTTKPRRKRFARAPLEREPKITPRILAMFDTIQSFGGVLSTVQLAMLFWPPSISRKLQYWTLGPDQVQTLFEHHSAAELDERVECLKFL
ncbi:MAG: hypothetical protein GY807_19185, partial [Gammaproteobacteria bacterium]|nr:hypothetical protein [Gammaproteobacteria bacterium]